MHESLFVGLRCLCTNHRHIRLYGYAPCISGKGFSQTKDIALACLYLLAWGCVEIGMYSMTRCMDLHVQGLTPFKSASTIVITDNFIH